jgi:hypothetical protein
LWSISEEAMRSSPAIKRPCSVSGNTGVRTGKGAAVRGCRVSGGGELPRRDLRVRACPLCCLVRGSRDPLTLVLEDRLMRALFLHCKSTRERKVKSDN